MRARYASETDVSPEKSRAEIERTLRRYGAAGFAYGWSGRDAMIGFEAHGRQIRIRISLPSLDDVKLSPRGRRRSSVSIQASALEKATRQCWRAMALVVKAKLEAVAGGISTFEEEFLAWTLLPDGLTVGERVLPAVSDAYRTGKVPPMLPSGKESRE